MVMKGEEHLTKIGFLLPPPSEIDIGADMKLQIQGFCIRGCNLLGNKLRILDGDRRLVYEVELSGKKDKAFITDEFLIKAPLHPGKYNWLLVFSGDKRDIREHGVSEYPFAFEAVAHRLNLAVWDIPSPILSGSSFFIKAGAKCTSNCYLGGQEILFYDHHGKIIGSGKLGGVTWPNSQSLYWCEMKLTAPPVEDYFTWLVRLPPQGLGLAHSAAHFTFSFRTFSLDGQKITVQVYDAENKEPIENAFVTIGACRGYTNASGIIEFNLPPQNYFFSVFKQGYEIFEKAIKISENSSLAIELEPAMPVF